MVVNYTRFKFTEGFSFKPIETATMERLDDSFVVNIYPYYNYSGIYYIESVRRKIFGTVVFRTMKSDVNNSDLSQLNTFNEYFISIAPDGSRASIYKSNLEGIMLKF
ncbi:hypothetical protein [Gelidibacter salicanalis]|uniref:Uncharacterized protein n=1 Tax=Gelidibacter salicanalis TaxID=291193 RepID=A0A934KN60_9FLAO|nr:hypothetical protein [Gelidibacter salicanalis]MBJ7882307.1 hypothetical protein [Gelidibacter salicanalis]